MAKILIVGGGVAGLSAGIYAQLQGHQAVIVEKHTVAGGNLTGWQRGEYHIDNCVHWLTGTNPNTSTYKMWEELGVLGNIEIMQGESLYTCEHNGVRLSLHKDLEKIKEEMLTLSPIDQVEIIRFINTIKLLQYVAGIGGENHNKKSGPFFYFKHFRTLFKYYKLSTGQLSKRFSHPAIKQFISCLIGEHFGALALLYVFATFTGENGGIPRGSSYAMAQRMINRFVSLGGELILGDEVVKINIMNDIGTSVILSSGETVNFDYAILTTDPKATFGKILDLPMPKQLNKSYNDKRLIRFSSYHCAFACDTDKLDFKGDYIFEIPQEYQNKLHSRHLILREFTHESSFAPKGKTVLQALIFCSEEDCRSFISIKNNKLAYESLKEELSIIILKLILMKFPKLKGKLHCIDVWTPATYKRFLGSDIGSYMSFALAPSHIPTQASHKIKGIKNVILATQWQQSPGGLPIAAYLGKSAIKTISNLESHKKYKSVSTNV